MSLGTDTYIDSVLAEYIPPEAASQSLLSEVFEDETNLLLFSLLVEARGGVAPGRQTGQDGKSEATYYASERPIAVIDTKQEAFDFGFRANLIHLRDFDAPISVAFKPETRQNRWIRLDPAEGDEPASFRLSDGTDTLWIRQPPDSDTDTSVRLEAFQ
jgi:hypothetical protein